MSGYYDTRYSFTPGRARVWRAITEHLQRYVREEDHVVDLGAGYCGFINHIRARTRTAIDASPAGKEHCAPGVAFHVSPATSLPMLTDGSADVVFASNLLEHLDDGEIERTLREISRVLKKGGRVMLLQPNFRYAYRHYFDDYTHRKAFTHVSLADLLRSHGFTPLAVRPRFLPFSFKGRLPQSYWLTRWYLSLPFRPGAKQMLLVFRKEG